MKRFLKWGCLISLALIVVVVSTAWQQIRQVRENLAVSEPLPVREVSRDPEKVQQIAQRAEAAGLDRVLRLRDPELTYAAQRALKHPEVLALLEKGRSRALRALEGVSDPLGFLDGLRLDAVDLARLRTEVQVADSRVTLRLTAPYLDGKTHLNVVAVVTGGWAPGAVRLEVQALTVGSLDVLALPFSGGWVRRQVDLGIKAAARVPEGGPLQDIRVEANAVVLRLSPQGARQLSALAREFLR
jgi:hypothetical protein